MARQKVVKTVEFHIREFDGKRQVAMRFNDDLLTETEYKVPKHGATIEATFTDFERRFPDIPYTVVDHTLE